MSRQRQQGVIKASREENQPNPSCKYLSRHFAKARKWFADETEKVIRGQDNAIDAVKFEWIMRKPRRASKAGQLSGQVTPKCLSLMKRVTNSPSFADKITLTEGEKRRVFRLMTSTIH